MTEKPASTKRPDGTISALASALGVSKRRIGDLLREGMPDEPQAALSWRAARENDDSASALRRERIGLIIEQRRLAKIAADEREGKLLSREEVDDRDRRIAHALQGMFRRMENEIPALCYGMNSMGEIKQVVKGKVRELQNTYADGMSEFWTSYPESNPKES